LETYGELQSHLDRALKIAERVSHQLDRTDEVHPLDRCRLLLSMDLKVMAAGSEALSLINPYCKGLGLGQRFDLHETELRDPFMTALVMARDDGGGPRLVRLPAAEDASPLIAVINRIGEKNQISIFLLPLTAEQKGTPSTTIGLGLTHAETELVRYLQQGMALKEAADQLNIAHNTARNHLKSVFAKVGVNRQSDLIRLLTMLSIAIPGRETRDKTLQSSSSFDGLAIYRNPSLVELKDGNKIAYHVYGPAIGKPILIFNSPLNEYVASAGMNALLYEMNICFICPQLSGRGQASFQPDYSWSKYRADIAELLTVLERRFNTQKFPAIGMAVGARFALEAAIACPSTLSALCLISPRVSPPEEERDSIGARLFRQFSKSDWALSFVAKVLSTRATDTFITKFVDRWLMDSPADQALFEREPDLKKALILGTKITVSEYHLGSAQALSMAIHEASLEWRRITTPILVCHGDRNGINTLENAQAITNSLPNAKLQIIPNMGQLSGVQHTTNLLPEFINFENAALNQKATVAQTTIATRGQ
ncbi:MAG: alpha/beta fold hydrolase, partial [Alphaproteobacteria bacterium]